VLARIAGTCIGGSRSLDPGNIRSCRDLAAAILPGTRKNREFFMQEIRKKSNVIHYFIDSAEYLTFTLGNSKLSNSILIFNLPAGSMGSCIMDCPQCYAKKAEKMYPSVKQSRWNNLNMLKKHGPNILITAISKILDYNSSINAIRFHESGDIYSDEYADAIKTAAMHARNRGIRSYLYTKTGYNSSILHPVNVVESILPDGDINFGSIDYVERKSKKYSDPICPATYKSKKIICGKDCKACMESRFIVFVQH